MFENLAEAFDTAAKAFLEEQQGMRVCQLDSLLVGLSIVVFAEMFAPNCVHVPECWQIIGGTNQLLCPRNKQSKHLPESALTPT